MHRRLTKVADSPKEQEGDDGGEGALEQGTFERRIRHDESEQLERGEGVAVMRRWWL